MCLLLEASTSFNLVQNYAKAGVTHYWTAFLQEKGIKNGERTNVKVNSRWEVMVKRKEAKEKKESDQQTAKESLCKFDFYWILANN